MGQEHVHVTALTEAPRQVRRSPPVQAKLSVGPAGDRYELEADRVADEVLRHLDAAPPSVTRCWRAARRIAGSSRA